VVVDRSVVVLLVAELAGMGHHVRPSLQTTGWQHQLVVVGGLAAVQGVVQAWQCRVALVTVFGQAQAVVLSVVQAFGPLVCSLVAVWVPVARRVVLKAGPASRMHDDTPWLVLPLSWLQC
jgi:hypothetical protein